MIIRDRAHPEHECKTLDAIAKAKGITPVERFIQIVKDGGASVVGKSMVEEDIRRFYSQPWVMVASDGGIGLRHPRRDRRVGERRARLGRREADGAVPGQMPPR